MVEIDRIVNGQKLERHVALIDGVQLEVDRKAHAIAHRAEAILATHHYSGDAHIEEAKGDIDAYVILVDPAALSIEFGRAGHIDHKGHLVGGMEGLHILAEATHLPIKRRGG